LPFRTIFEKRGSYLPEKEIIALFFLNAPDKPVCRWIKTGLAFSRSVDQKGIGENTFGCFCRFFAEFVSFL